MLARPSRRASFWRYPNLFDCPVLSHPVTPLKLEDGKCLDPHSVAGNGPTEMAETRPALTIAPHCGFLALRRTPSQRRVTAAQDREALAIWRATSITIGPGCRGRARNLAPRGRQRSVLRGPFR